jgi:predicted negative regulator of RcsB-dependent stress response
MKALAIVLLTAAWGQAQENAVEVLQRASEAYKKTLKAITSKASGKRLSAATFIIPGRRASKRSRRLCRRIRSGSNPGSTPVGM